MKYIFKNVALFAVLSVLLSSFSGCTKTANSPSNDGDNAALSSSTPTNNGGGSPPAPTAIMQADIKDIDGNLFKLGDKKGKVLLVNLWATWCVPCRQEMPDLVELQEKYRDKNFEIIGLDSDDTETPEDVKAFAKTMKLNYQLGYADPKLMNDFLKTSKFGGIPQTFLIDREGRLRNVFVGGGQTNVDKIKEAVEKTVNES